MDSPLFVDPRMRPSRGSSRFRPLLKIASGGMGSVYLGRQKGPAGFQRLVAIKRSHPHLLEDTSIVRMLALEARLASLVRHPNVVGVTDVEIADGELLLVMEYVEGGSLAEIVAGGMLSIGIALRVILDVCEGLDAVHKTLDEKGKHIGLVHRDVSPQNILVGIDGVARVADLGIARASAVQGTTTVIRGKPNYMAPEYVSTAKATPATDVFSLGVVAWETLTGERFYGEIVEPDGEEGSVRVPRPSSLRAEIPACIDEVVLKAVAWNAQERFASAHDFAIALEAAARNACTPSSPALPASRAEVGGHITRLLGPKLHARREMLLNDTPTEGLASREADEHEATPTSTTDDPPSSARFATAKHNPRLAAALRIAALPLLAALVVLVVASVTKFRLTPAAAATTAEGSVAEGAKAHTTVHGEGPMAKPAEVPIRDPAPVSKAATMAAAPAPDPTPDRVPAPAAAPPRVEAPTRSAVPGAVPTTRPDVSPRVAEPAPGPRPPTKDHGSLLAAPPVAAPDNPYGE